MGALKDVNRDDLLNRFASHTFTETTVGDHTKVEFKDSGSVVIAEATTLVVDDAYHRIRQALVGGGSILIGDFTFQGSTKFGGDTTIAPNSAIDVAGTNAATTRIRSVRFQNTATGAAALQLGHSRGTEGSPSALSSGDLLGQLRFVGDDGSTSNGAGVDIFGVTTEGWGGSAKGSKLTFETTPNGTTSAVLAFTVSEHGYPEATTYTVATLPNVGAGGGIILVSDETGGSTLAFSDGSSWRRVTDRAVVS